jgi:hypothetical protein
MLARVRAQVFVFRRPKEPRPQVAGGPPPAPTPLGSVPLPTFRTHDEGRKQARELAAAHAGAAVRSVSVHARVDGHFVAYVPAE